MSFILFHFCLKLGSGLTISGPGPFQDEVYRDWDRLRVGLRVDENYFDVFVLI